VGRPWLVADGNAHGNTPPLETAPAGKPGVDATDLPARR
jgi:hypothetical protein